jgi:hypothetical protein
MHQSRIPQHAAQRPTRVNSSTSIEVVERPQRVPRYLFNHIQGHTLTRVFMSKVPCAQGDGLHDETRVLAVGGIRRKMVEEMDDGIVMFMWKASQRKTLHEL